MLLLRIILWLPVNIECMRVSIGFKALYVEFIFVVSKLFPYLLPHGSFSLCHNRLAHLKCHQRNLIFGDICRGGVPWGGEVGESGPEGWTAVAWAHTTTHWPNGRPGVFLWSHYWTTGPLDYCTTALLPHLAWKPPAPARPSPSYSSTSSSTIWSSSTSLLIIKLVAFIKLYNHHVKNKWV